MTFVDTPAIYAVLDQSDQNHAAARAVWLRLLESGSPMFTTNDVVVECCALAQNRLGRKAVHTFHEDFLPALEVRWIDAAAHTLAMAALLAARRKNVTLVDFASFSVMRQVGSRVAFAFDRHFAEERFAFPG